MVSEETKYRDDKRFSGSPLRNLAALVKNNNVLAEHVPRVESRVFTQPAWARNQTWTAVSTERVKTSPRCVQLIRWGRSQIFCLIQCLQCRVQTLGSVLLLTGCLVCEVRV